MSSATSSSSSTQAPLDALAAAAQLHAGTKAATTAHLATVVEESSTSVRPAVAAARASSRAPLAAAASSSTAASVPQPKSSSSAAGETVTAIKMLIPKALLCRCIEYRKQPAFWPLHRESAPAVFRPPEAIAATSESTLYLWSDEERAAIVDVFPLPGCKQRLSQPDHSFCSLFAATPPTTPDAAAAAASAAASAPRAVERGVNATLLDTIASTAVAAGAVRSFVRGPALFQSHDLLPDAARPFQLVVALRGSFIGANTGLYGCDECVHLREGERLWYIAPPDELEEFRKLFDGNTKATLTTTKQAQKEAKTSTLKSTNKAVAVTKASTVHTALLLSHGVHAVHQKAGDTIYVPGGWVRAVKNLTDTVSFGSFYLRAWNLEHTIAFAEEEIKQGRLTADSGCVIDLPEIFRTLQQHSDDQDFGVSSVAAKTTVAAWHASNAYALLCSASSSALAAAPAAGSKRKRTDRDATASCS